MLTTDAILDCVSKRGADGVIEDLLALPIVKDDPMAEIFAHMDPPEQQDKLRPVRTNRVPQPHGTHRR